MIDHTLAATVFDAIVDPTRRKILELVHTAERPVGELVLELQMEQTSVSKHLRVLRDAGLVTVRPIGRQRYYGLDSTGLQALDEWLARLRER